MKLFDIDESQAIIGFISIISSVLLALILATSLAGVLTNAPGYRTAFLLFFGLFVLGCERTLNKMDIWKNPAGEIPITQRLAQSVGLVFTVASVLSFLMG